MATKTNDKSIWDALWGQEGLDTWRKYPGPIGRISWLLQNATRETQEENEVVPTLVDLGCGVGHLLSRYMLYLRINVLMLSILESICLP